MRCSKSRKDRQHNDQRKASKWYRPLVNHPPILSASVLTWFIRYIFLSNLLLLNHLIIIKKNSSHSYRLPYPIFSSLSSLCRLFALLLLQRTFGFQICVVPTKCDNDVLIIIILNEITTFRFVSNQPNVQT